MPAISDPEAHDGAAHPARASRRRLPGLRAAACLTARAIHGRTFQRPRGVGGLLSRRRMLDAVRARRADGRPSRHGRLRRAGRHQPRAAVPGQGARLARLRGARRTRLRDGGGKGVRDWAAEALGLDRLVSYIDPHNARSIAVAERLGAVLDPDAAKQDPEDLVYRHRPGNHEPLNIARLCWRNPGCVFAHPGIAAIAPASGNSPRPRRRPDR